MLHFRARAAPLLLSLWLAGCGHVPVSSMVRLARIDLGTSDLAQLRAAVRHPDVLALRGDSRMHVTVRAGGIMATQTFRLVALPEPGPDAAQAAVLAIHPRELARAEVFRDEIRLRQKGGAKGSVTIGITPDICRKGPLPPGPLPVSTYLKTSETGGFVVLTEGLDLRGAAGDAITKIPPC